MTGKTVEEAVDAACASLELTRDEVSYEVLEVPQKRLFGSSLAKVRVYAEKDNFTIDDILSPKIEVKTKEVSSKKVFEKPIETISIKTEEIQEEKTEVVTEQPVVLEEPEIPEKTEEPVVEVTAVVEEIILEQDEVLEQKQDEEPIDMPESAQAAFSYLKDIASKMNLHKLEFNVVKVEGGVKFTVDGDDAATLIGRHGETMEALQYLCLLVGNRVGGEYCKISLDVADYRSRREQSLQSQARRVAEKVRETRRSQTLDSMSAYERRIIHSTIQNIKGVQSESIGNDPNRRVVVFVEGDRMRSSNSRGGYKGRNSNSHNNRGRYDDQPKPPSTPTKNEETKKQNEELGKNLYGKIDF